MPGDDRQSDAAIKLPSIHEMFSGFHPNTSQPQTATYQHHPQAGSYRHPPVPPPSGHSQTCYSHAQDAPYPDYRRAPYPAQHPACNCYSPAYTEYSCQCPNHPPTGPWQAPYGPDPHYYPQSRAPYPCHCAMSQDGSATPASHWSPTLRSSGQWSEPSPRVQSQPYAQPSPSTRFVPVNSSIRKFSPSATAFDDGSSFEGDPRSKHVCQQCHKTFTRPSSLRIHMNTHTGATPFKCPWPDCGREFNVNSNMRRHLRSHKANMDRHSRQSSPMTSSDGDRQLSNADFRLDDVSLISPET